MAKTKTKSTMLDIQDILLGISVILFWIYYTALSFLRYDNYYTGRYDLGNMTQVVWNTAHGRFFQFTNPDDIFTVNRLAFHADFILVFFAPFYWIWESPKVLLLFQSLIVGAGAIFIYLISLSLIKNKNISLAFAFSYLINPAVGWSTLFDFHAVTLATTFLLGTIYFLIKKQYRWFLLFAILAALTKEQVWLIISLFGVILFFFHKKRLMGSILFLASGIIFYLIIFHAIPNASATKEYFAVTYFSEDGGSTIDLIKGFITSPKETFQTLTDSSRLDYLRALFLPLGYLSLLFPFWLIFTIPDFALNLLSGKEELHHIYYHYTATITPFIFSNAIFAVYFITKRFKNIPNFVFSLFIVIFAVIGAYNFGPLLYTKQPNDEMVFKKLLNRHEIDEVLKKIPESARVAAGNELGAQLSHRQHIYTLGVDVRDADYVAFFTRNSDPKEAMDNSILVEELRNNPEFVTWYEKDNLLIFKKLKPE